MNDSMTAEVIFNQLYPLKNGTTRISSIVAKKEIFAELLENGINLKLGSQIGIVFLGRINSTIPVSIDFCIGMVLAWSFCQIVY